MLGQPKRNPLARLMAKVIEFYVPNRFQKKVAWVPPMKRGKMIEFCVQVKSAQANGIVAHAAKRQIRI